MWTAYATGTAFSPCEPKHFWVHVYREALPLIFGQLNERTLFCVLAYSIASEQRILWETATATDDGSRFGTRDSMRHVRHSSSPIELVCVRANETTSRLLLFVAVFGLYLLAYALFCKLGTKFTISSLWQAQTTKYVYGRNCAKNKNTQIMREIYYHRYLFGFAFVQ